MTRLEKIINNRTIYIHIVETYKALLKEGDKRKIDYFKALIKGCIRRNVFDGKNSNYISPHRFLWEDCHHNFLNYTNASYDRYIGKKSGGLFPHFIYGYETKELIKTIF